MKSLPLVVATFLACAPHDVAFCADPDSSDENERVIVMEAFKVGANAIENFGLQVDREMVAATSAVFVIAVVPNTAAAKAGLKPGDRIWESDGKPVTPSPRRLFGETDWKGFYVPPSKRAAVAQGAEVSWTLKVQSHESGSPIREVKLSLPTAPPRWGSKIWSPPEGRSPASISEPGQLALLAKTVMDNGVAVMLRQDLSRNLIRRSFFYGYQWSVGEGRSYIVSQARGRTDIIIQSGKNYFLTSPSAELEDAVRHERVPQLDPWAHLPRSVAEAPFQREVSFWLNDVGQGSARWPLELRRKGQPSVGSAPFAQLPALTPAQHALLQEALAAMDREKGSWAYTETTKGTDAKTSGGTRVVRVDPSKSDGTRFTLVQLNGKAPTDAEISQWRESADEEKNAANSEDIPALASLLDFAAVRLRAEDQTTTVFEIALRPENALQLSPEKSEALLRVNHARRSPEHLALKSRDAIAVVAGNATLTSEMEVWFEILDPACAPQPVKIITGGAARAGLLKLSRYRETTRTQHQRVQPPASLE
jgi:hypothetical protein